MTEIPKFETICDLFEQKPNAWEKVRPYLHLALMLAPGAVFGSFGTLAGTLGALDSGLTLSGAVELLENTLFHTKGLFRKKPDFASPFDLPRLANTMVIFAAWFDTLEEEAPGLWRGLALDVGGFQWMQEECQAEYRRVQELVGGDGRNILISDGREMQALKQFYVLLMERTRKLAQGLAATENQRADWARYPELAVKKYCRYCEILKKYEPYRSWVGQQYLESILRILLDHQPQPSREPGKLHLPASSSLLESGLFRGRKKDLAKIERTFAEQDIVVLTGLGGMGKTELSIAYAARQPDTAEVYFLPFQGSFRETIARAAMEGLPEYANRKLTTEEAFPITWNLLLKCRKDNLLILDNVDTSVQTLNAVIKELGKLPMRCLVTTRHRSAGAIEVGKLSEEELLQIFDDNDAPVGREDRLRLINAVDRHTLTVSLIAQTLQGGMVKAKTILDALGKQNFDDISLPEVDAHFPGAEEQKKIYGHLRTVFRVSNMSNGARLAMTCAVLLPQGGMDADTFQAALDKDAANALFSLSRNGWLSWHDDLISIHPVIRLVCKNELKPTDESCGPFLDRLWDQLDPYRYDQTYYHQLAELYTVASNSLADMQKTCSLRAGALWSKLGEHQKNIGDYNKALEFTQIALTIYEKFLPDNHPDLASSYNNMGNTYNQLGEHGKALEFELKALAIREKVLPVDHPDLAASYNNVGSTYGDLGDHSKALEFLLKSLAIIENVLPENHPDLASSYNNVGSTYGNLGDHSKALEFMLKALAFREKVLPEDHPDLATSYNNVGSIYGNLGDHSKALEFMLKALDIREKVLPEGHPNLAASYNNVGITYSDLGNHNKALEFMLKALAIREKSLPEGHPDIAASCSNIAFTLAQMSQFPEALPYIRRAVTIAESSLPEGHPDLKNFRQGKKMLELFAMLQEAGIDLPNPFK